MQPFPRKRLGPVFVPGPLKVLGQVMMLLKFTQLTLLLCRSIRRLAYITPARRNVNDSIDPRRVWKRCHAFKTFKYADTTGGTGLRPVSHRETVVDVTPSFADKASCVSRSRLRIRLSSSFVINALYRKAIQKLSRIFAQESCQDLSGRQGKKPFDFLL